MKELREHIRYLLESEYRVFPIVEVEGRVNINGIAWDLSTGGFSFVIDMNNITDSEVDLEKFFFIRINFDRFIVSAEVEKKWSLIKNADNNKMLIAGVSFRAISNEDRLRLNEMVESLRSESSLSWHQSET